MCTMFVSRGPENVLLRMPCPRVLDSIRGVSAVLLFCFCGKVEQHKREADRLVDLRREMCAGRGGGCMPKGLEVMWHSQERDAPHSGSSQPTVRPSNGQAILSAFSWNFAGLLG